MIFRSLDGSGDQCVNRENFSNFIFDEFRCPLSPIYNVDEHYCCGPLHQQYCCSFWGRYRRALALFSLVLFFLQRSVGWRQRCECMIVFSNSCFPLPSSYPERQRQSSLPVSCPTPRNSPRIKIQLLSLSLAFFFSFLLLVLDFPFLFFLLRLLSCLYSWIFSTSKLCERYVSKWTFSSCSKPEALSIDQYSCYRNAVGFLFLLPHSLEWEIDCGSSSLARSYENEEDSIDFIRESRLFLSF